MADDPKSVGVNVAAVNVTRAGCSLDSDRRKRQTAAMSDATVPLDGGLRSLSVAVDAGSLAAVRDQVRDVAYAHGLSYWDATKFVLAVHELLVNAIRHGGGRAELVVSGDPPGLRCVVTDSGRGAAPHRVDPRREPPDARIRGLGLRLVRRICTHVEARFGPDGSHVTAVYHPGPTDLPLTAEQPRRP
jgi:anti-sigma regulatory factor (Ser/Thr protein kinase)